MMFGIDNLILIPDSDQTLHTKTDPMSLEELADPEFQTLTNQMLDFMRLNRGMGLAAPQIGINRAFFVMSHGGINYVCVNPEIIESSKKVESLTEGCLSYPGEKLAISRPEEIKVTYLDLNGKRKTHRLRGILARCYQHELDHLNGIVMRDRYGSTDRDGVS